jgi:hypothetical protein
VEASYEAVVAGPVAHHHRRADRTQFSLLVTVVVASAIVPTAVAQRWFAPHVSPARA